MKAGPFEQKTFELLTTTRPKYDVCLTTAVMQMLLRKCTTATGKARLLTLDWTV